MLDWIYRLVLSFRRRIKPKGARPIYDPPASEKFPSEWQVNKWAEEISSRTFKAFLLFYLLYLLLPLQLVLLGSLPIEYFRAFGTIVLVAIGLMLFIGALALLLDSNTGYNLVFQAEALALSICGCISFYQVWQVQSAAAYLTLPELLILPALHVAVMLSWAVSTILLKFFSKI